MSHKLLLLGIIFLFSCSKKIEIREVEVEVEKKYSWQEIKHFFGTEKIFLSSGSNGKALFFQQPYYFTELKSQNEKSGITTYGAGLPTNIDIRIPIAPNFSAFAVSDTGLRVINNERPIASPSGGYYNLKALDPTLTAIQQTTNGVLFKAMAINSNGVLLLSYANNRPSQPLTFMMLKIKTSFNYPYVDTLYSKVIAVPRTSVSAYARYFIGVEDYFLATLSGNGIYKFTEDGNFSKVYNPATVDAFYEWKGKVYAHIEWDRLLISSDRGNSWEEYNGIPNLMVTTSYYKIKDSLIGANRDNLFTLSWNNTTYSLRLLKNDGLEGSRINGVEILNDTVYAATTKGLYCKPVASFFASK